MTLRLADGRTTFLDFREKAPLRPRRDMFLGRARQRRPGPLDRYLARRRGAGLGGRARHGAGAVWHPAAPRPCWRPRSASPREGFVLGPGRPRRARPGHRTVPPRPGGCRHLPPGRPARSPPATAWSSATSPRTLEALAADGPDAFYRGPIGDAIVAAEPGRRRHPAEARLRDLHASASCRRSAAPTAGTQISSAAAAELRRNRDLRDPEHPRGLRPARHGIPLRRARSTS